MLHDRRILKLFQLFHRCHHDHLRYQKSYQSIFHTFFNATGWFKNISFNLFIMTIKIRRHAKFIIRKVSCIISHHLLVYKSLKPIWNNTRKLTELFFTLIWVSLDCDYCLKLFMTIIRKEFEFEVIWCL